MASKAMKVKLSTIRSAFEEHRRKYVNSKERPWDVPNHARLWAAADTAFRKAKADDFAPVYDELRSYWQVFRGSRPRVPSAKEVFGILTTCDNHFRMRGLSSTRRDDVPGLWKVIMTACRIKRNKSGPSIVAASKFLHFWNPRLFVIVDSGMMWNTAFAHDWLSAPIRRIRESVEGAVTNPTERGDIACDPLSYLAILLWAGELVRENPGIVEEFGAYLTLCTNGQGIQAKMCSYEAAAVEWFLLGLVELPPAGVTI